MREEPRWLNGFHPPGPAFCGLANPLQSRSSTLMLLCRQARDPEIWEGGCSGLLSGIDGRESRDDSGSRDELWDALFWGVRHWIKFVSESEARKGVRKEGVQAENKKK